MKKKDKIIIIVCFVIILICIIWQLVLQKLNKDLDEELKKLGTVEHETVEVLIAKFNTEIMDNTDWKLEPVNDGNMSIEDDIYWYWIKEGIVLGVEPEKFTGDKTKDIARIFYLQVDKQSGDIEDWKQYGYYLIKANNYDITDNDAKELIDKAEKNKDSNNGVNNGKGIYLGIRDEEDFMEYQIKRILK